MLQSYSRREQKPTGASGHRMSTIAARMISFVVPAHNEEATLPRTLAAIVKAAREVGQAFEVIVVDDLSTDATTSIAAGFGARVVPVNLRQISAVRNAGARAA